MPKNERSDHRIEERDFLNYLLLLKYGEISLKGKNRPYFENRLIDNIRSRLKDVDYVLHRRQGRLYIECNDLRIIPTLQDTFGLVEICPARKCAKDLQEIQAAALEEAREVIGDAHVSFKVDTRRIDKSYPHDSMQISRAVGTHLLKNMPNLHVDVHTPQHRLEIELRDDVYLYLRRYRAAGGMPYATSSGTVLLLSGGIDSPVAAYQMARRGVILHPLHFHAAPFTSEEAFEKVRELTRRIARFTGPLRLNSMNLAKAQQLIRRETDERYFTLIQRRLMTRLANRLAKKLRAQSISTGENLAQVASQTMEGLRSTHAVSELPVFRPLISFDKEDIVIKAKEMGTYDVSILPFDDCCTIFLPKTVITKPRLEDIEQEEAKLDMEQLIDMTWETYQREHV